MRVIATHAQVSKLQSPTTLEESVHIVIKHDHPNLPGAGTLSLYVSCDSGVHSRHGPNGPTTSILYRSILCGAVSVTELSIALAFL